LTQERRAKKGADSKRIKKKLFLTTKRLANEKVDQKTVPQRKKTKETRRGLELGKLQQFQTKGRKRTEGGREGLAWDSQSLEGQCLGEEGRPIRMRGRKRILSSGKVTQFLGGRGPYVKGTPRAYAKFIIDGGGNNFFRKKFNREKALFRREGGPKVFAIYHHVNNYGKGGARQRRKKNLVRRYQDFCLVLDFLTLPSPRSPRALLKPVSLRNL